MLDGRRQSVVVLDNLWAEASSALSRPVFVLCRPYRVGGRLQQTCPVTYYIYLPSPLARLASFSVLYKMLKLGIEFMGLGQDCVLEDILYCISCESNLLDSPLKHVVYL